MSQASVLLQLGANSSFDPTKLSNSTLKSVISHIKTLTRNGIEINEQVLTLDTEYMLDRLVDTKGRLLKDQYKRQIGMTIKRLYPQADVSLQQYNKAHNESRNSKTRTSSEEFMTSVRKIRDRSVEILQDVYAHKRIDDLGLYDACIAVLLTLCTSLRIEEVRQLKFSHIQKILAREPIGIKSKASFAARFIAPNELLTATFTTIETQRQLVEESVKLRKLDHAMQKQQYRIDAGYILISSTDYMRKKLHELAASCGIKLEILGFTVFRKLTTSILIEGGGHLVAQTMNNHSSVNTTLEHYNMITSQSVQTAYDNLFGVSDPPQPIPEPPDEIVEPILETRSKPKHVPILSEPRLTYPEIKKSPARIETKTIIPTSSDSTPMIVSESIVEQILQPTVDPKLIRSTIKRPPSRTDIYKKRKQDDQIQELTNEISDLKSRVQNNSSIADIITLKNDIESLKVSQQTNASVSRDEIQKLKSQVDILPQKLDESFKSVQQAAYTQLHSDFNTAINTIKLETEQIQNLKTELTNKIRTLENKGVDRNVLAQLETNFEDKIAKIENTCVSAQQIKSEYDEKLKQIDNFIVAARVSPAETFDSLVTNLETTLQNTVANRTQDIYNQLASVSQNLAELGDTTLQTKTSQIENDEKFRTLGSELSRLQRLITESSTDNDLEPFRKRSRIEQMKRILQQQPFETPPHMQSDVMAEDETNL